MRVGVIATIVDQIKSLWSIFRGLRVSAMSGERGDQSKRDWKIFLVDEALFHVKSPVDNCRLERIAGLCRASDQQFGRALGFVTIREITTS